MSGVDVPGPVNGRHCPTAVLDTLAKLVGAAVFIPIPFSRKGPVVNAWQDTTYEQTQADAYRQDLATAVRRGGNLGVLLGPPSGDLVAVDVDSDAFMEEFRALNPKMQKTLCSRGARGCQFWLHMRLGSAYPTQVHPLRFKDGRKFGEWRGGDCQSVIYGRHPDGMNYRLLSEMPAMDYAFEDIVWPKGLVLPWNEGQPTPTPTQEPHPDGSGLTDRIALKAFVQANALSICEHFLPNGKLESGEWKLGDATGIAGDSLGVTLNGEKAGLYFDFDPHKGQDLIDLLKSAKGWSFLQTVDAIESAFGVTFRTPLDTPNTADFRETPPTQNPDPLYEDTEDDAGGREPFPLDALPSPYREMAEAVAKSAMVPVVLTAASTLAVVSAALGKKLQIRSKADRLTPTMLFMILFAGQAGGKSVAARLLMKPLTDLHLALERKWQEEDYPAILAELDDIDEAFKRIKKDHQDDEFIEGAPNPDKKALIKRRLELEQKTMPALCIDDLTIEAFAVGLKSNDEQMTLFSVDAGKTIQNLLGRYNPSGEPDDAMHRKAFSMDFHTERRLSRGPITLEAPAATLLWFAQPYLIPTIFNNEVLKHGGFISRCLVVDTKAEIENEPEVDTPIPDDVREEYYLQVKSLFQTFRLNPCDPTIIEPGPEVRTIMRDNFNRIAERRRSGDLKDIQEFAARWNELAWRILGGLHSMRWNADAGKNELEPETAFDAIRIQRWFEQEELRLLAPGRDQAATDKTDRLIDAVCRKSTSQNDESPRVRLRALERLGWERDDILNVIAASNGIFALETPPLKGPGRPPSFVVLKGKPRSPNRGNTVSKGTDKTRK